MVKLLIIERKWLHQATRTLAEAWERHSLHSQVAMDPLNSSSFLRIEDTQRNLNVDKIEANLRASSGED